MLPARCDLHVHSIRSTDSGNYALRRARLGESHTAPERVYDLCRARGMNFVTISDHNTLDGALRIADRPDAFLSVEVTTRFPEDDLPLHVLVWNLSEEDHRDLQPYRPSVYELDAFLNERGLAHALAHPLSGWARRSPRRTVPARFRPTSPNRNRTLTRPGRFAPLCSGYRLTSKLDLACSRPSGVDGGPRKELL